MEEIISMLPTIGSGIGGALISFFLTKRKYNEEVRTLSIDNDLKREEFHNNIELNFLRLIASMLELINSQAILIANLTSTLVSLLKIVCENTTCQFRQPLKKELVEALLKGDNYGTEANLKV